MTYDNKNNGVGFSSSAFSGKIDFDGVEYKLAFVGAGDNAKFKYNVFIWNKDESYQTVIFDGNKKSDKSPDYSGQIKLDNGAEYWLSVWHKKSDKGHYFLSVSVKAKDSQSVMDKTSFADSYKQNDDLDQSIPF